MPCLNNVALKTGINTTDIGNIFVSYSDLENLLTQNCPIATLIFTNTSTSEDSSINFYTTQKRTNTYNIPNNTLVTLIVYSGYYVNLNLGSGNTIYYPGNYALVDTSSTTATIVINSINVYNPVGQYWSLYPASTTSATYGSVYYDISNNEYTTTDASSNSISTSTFTSILGNNYNNTNIVLANGSILPYIPYIYPPTTTSTLYTNYFVSTTNDLSNLSFSQLILTIPFLTTSFNNDNDYNDYEYYTILYNNSPVSISSDNSTLFYALNVISGKFAYNSTISSNQWTYTIQVIPYLFSIDNGSFTYKSGGIGSAITLGTYTPTDPIASYVNLCQVEILNGQPFCMMGGNTGAWVNNGTSGTSLAFTQVKPDSTMALNDINSISMSETGQYQLIGGDYLTLYSNNFGLTFNLIYTEDRLTNLQISSQSQYAVATGVDSFNYIPFISSDYGETWVPIPGYDTSKYTTSITSITISSNGQNIIINNQVTSFYSNDNGTTFTETTSTTTANNISFIFPSEQPIAIALGSVGEASTVTGIYISQ